MAKTKKRTEFLPYLTFVRNTFFFLEAKFY